MSGGERTGPTLQAVWNLRALGIFLLGPVVGMILGAGVFGMPATLIRIAGIMFLFSLAMFAVLVREARRRLVPPRRPPTA